DRRERCDFRCDAAGHLDLRTHGGGPHLRLRSGRHRRGQHPQRRLHDLGVNARMAHPLSLTRTLVSELRRRLGEEDPLPQPAPLAHAPTPPPLPQPPPPPARFFPTPKSRSRFADEAAKHTTALVGIGHVGTRYATDGVLQFQAELPVAHEAVDTILDDSWAAAQGYLPLHSRVQDHREFLLRPDLGRRLDDASVARLREAKHDVDVRPILADGLSAVALQGSGPELVDAFSAECVAR